MCLNKQFRAQLTKPPFLLHAFTVLHTCLHRYIHTYTHTVVVVLVAVYICEELIIFIQLLYTLKVLDITSNFNKCWI